MKLVIAEKPSVGRDIARVLGALRRAEGYVSGNGYVVTWAIGHLVHFFEPDDYGGLWADRWSIRQLPMVPEKWRYKTLPDTAAQFKIVKKLIGDARITEIICATDAGREGEHIFRLLYEHTNCHKPFKRLWISSLTEEAIRAGFAALNEGRAFDALAAAARARAQADWLVGMNLTRAYTVHHGALCPVGRVQTPTLALIVARDEQIRQFSKTYFYELVATLEEGFWAKYLGGGKTRIETRQEADRLHARTASEQTGTITSVITKTVRHRPPPLFDLISLQKEANRRFGLTAAKVLELAQQLYERYKLITYPRTESRHLPEDMLGRLPSILAGLEHPLAGEALARFEAGHKLSKAYVDKTKLSDHHGIVPTGGRARLTPDLEKVYQLIVARFIGIFLPDHLVEETTVLVAIGSVTFRAKSSVVTETGWKVIDKGRKAKGAGDEIQALPPLRKGQVVGVADLKVVEKETSPPKPFTDATLLTAMKRAGRILADDTLAEAMKESGLGTSATRAAIIEKLLRTRLIERRKKNIFPTTKGIALIQAIAEPLKSPELTGKWESRLKDIEEGRGSGADFYRSIVAFVTDMLNDVRHRPRVAELRSNASPKQTKAAKRQSRSAPPAPKKHKSERDIANCPICSTGRVIEGHKAFGCSRFREGCAFRLGKVVYGKKLTKRQVATLVSKGRTALLSGFLDEHGQKTKARLLLTVEGPGSVLTLEKKQPQTSDSPLGLHCPKCQRGSIIKGRQGFGCNRFRDGCHFVVWRMVAGKKLTDRQIHSLIAKGGTPLIRGFVDDNGKKYAGWLSLDAQFETKLKISD